MLRDELAVTLLARWVLEEDAVPPDEVRRLLLVCLGERGAGFRIGESGTESVFTRSFSVLAAAIFVAADNDRMFLEEEDVVETVDAVVRYCDREIDLRSTVPGSGWAHSIAHAADLIDECARSRFATTSSSARLGPALCSMALRSGEVFQGEEDERVATALAAVGRLVSWEEVAGYIEGTGENERHNRINRKHIARSLLSRLDAEADRESLEKLVELERFLRP